MSRPTTENQKKTLTYFEIPKCLPANSWQDITSSSFLKKNRLPTWINLIHATCIYILLEIHATSKILNLKQNWNTNTNSPHHTREHTTHIYWKKRWRNRKKWFCTHPHQHIRKDTSQIKAPQHLKQLLNQSWEHNINTNCECPLSASHQNQNTQSNSRSSPEDTSYN